jgi:hypothetical protein
VASSILDAGGGVLDDVLASLLHAAGSVPAERLVDVVAEHGRRLGLADVQIWLVDHGQRRLVRLVPPGGTADSLPVDGCCAGDAFRWLRPTAEGPDHWLPLTVGNERLGVLQVRPANPPGVGDGGLPAVDLEAFALLVGELVMTKGDYSDHYFRLRRREVMSLEAELQWGQLPPLDAHCGNASLAGTLEPAYQVGGDAFDHAYDDGNLHFAVFDAVGHDVAAAIVSHVVLGTYRHARRLGQPLGVMAAMVDAAVATHLGGSQFATGVLAHLECATGRLAWLGIGHPTPLLVRRGEVRALKGPTSRPFGLGLGPLSPEVVQLEPGDRLLLFTDGAVDGRLWRDYDEGVAWLGGQVVEAVRLGMRPGEVVRRLMLATVDRWRGNQRDDATLLLVEWTPS